MWVVVCMCICVSSCKAHRCVWVCMHACLCSGEAHSCVWVCIHVCVCSGKAHRCVWVCMHRCIHLPGGKFVRCLFWPVSPFHIEVVSLTRLVYLPSPLAPADPLSLQIPNLLSVGGSDGPPLPSSIYLGAGNADSSPSICTKTLYLRNHVFSPVCFLTQNWGYRFHKALSLTQGTRWGGRGI